jgi:hypothetical protein
MKFILCSWPWGGVLALALAGCSKTPDCIAVAPTPTDDGAQIDASVRESIAAIADSIDELPGATLRKADVVRMVRGMNPLGNVDIAVTKAIAIAIGDGSGPMIRPTAEYVERMRTVELFLDQRQEDKAAEIVRQAEIRLGDYPVQQMSRIEAMNIIGGKQ